MIEYEQNQVVYEQLLEKTDNFQIDIENLFDKIKDPFRLVFSIFKIKYRKIKFLLLKNEQQINKITLICRKANENENFRYLLHNVNIYNNHPKIFFKKIDNMVEILGDKDMLDGSLEQVLDSKKIKKFNLKSKPMRKIKLMEVLLKFQSLKI